MGKRLSQMVTIKENNEECVILKVKKNQFDNLIGLGCFNGDETMFRLTKGSDHTCTVWYGTENRHFSWEWGSSGYTLVSDNVKKRGSLIHSCIADDFGIYIGDDKVKIRQTLYKRKPTEKKTEKFVAMWWEGEESRIVHRKGEFWKSFGNEDTFMDYVQKMGGKVKSKSVLYHSSNTGCCMMDFEVEL